MNPLNATLLSVAIVSLISLIGALTLYFKKKLLHKLIFSFVSFAAGALLSAAFFDLIPKAIEMREVGFVMPYVLLGLFVMFFLEKFLYWFHHHNGRSHVRNLPKPFAVLNLVGDGIHNAVDGMLIATAYLVSPALGLISTLAVVFHEIPQEFGDFAILIYGGYTEGKALFYNFLSALTAFLGAFLAYYFGHLVNSFVPFLLAFAAGGFIYIAAADLIPEIHKERKAALTQTVIFILGILVMWGLTRFAG